MLGSGLIRSILVLQIACVLAALTSCATIGNRLKPDDCLGNTLLEPIYLYGGIRCDIRFLSSKHQLDDPWTVVFLDIPLSLAADTLLLPWAAFDYFRANKRIDQKKHFLQ